jgi:hypothetical protein
MRALLVLIAMLIAAPAWAQDSSVFALCETAINNAQQSEVLPPGLLPAIAQVESGRFDPMTGRTRPWPWTIDANGAGQMFDTKTQAIAAVHALQGQGISSIDIGCLQVNLLHHPLAFASLDDAFDPATNAAYAARFLRTLFAETGNWPVAAAAYHSRTPALGADYATLVMAIWQGKGAVTAETLSAAAHWPHRFAMAPPPLHPFAPPPLAGVPADPSITGTALAELLSPSCVVPHPAAGWLLPSHTPGCGRSAFASTTGLQRALAAMPVKAAMPPPSAMPAWATRSWATPFWAMSAWAMPPRAMPPGATSVR